MTYYITYLKDKLGQNYLGIRIDQSQVQPYLDELKKLIGEADFTKFTDNQKLRDGAKYHITVIGVADYAKCIQHFGMDKFINALDQRIFHFEIDDLQFQGLGTAQDGPNRCFFIVCKSDKLAAIRTRFELSELDPHITLGFDKKDVHGVRKNQILKKGPKFLKLLEIEYYKSRNWEFVKKIGNFNFDRGLDLMPVELTESILTLKCGGHYIQVIYLEDGEKFWVGTSSAIADEKPVLTDAQIEQIFNKYN